MIAITAGPHGGASAGAGETASRPRLKVGLLVNSEHVSKHVYELVHWAQSTHSLQFTHLIVQQRPASETSLLSVLKRKGPVALLTQLLWRVKNRVESRAVAAIPGYEGHNRTFDVGALVPGRIFLSAIVSSSGLVHRFSDSDLEQVRREQFDCLIRAGAGILKGGILTSARLGILSFHHGDNRINRGGPPGFWEVYYRQSATGYVVQRLTETLDGGDVILRGYTPTQATHLLNCAMLFNKSYFQLRQLLLRIAATGELPPIEAPVPYAERLFVAPRLRELLCYLCMQMSQAFVARARQILGRQERWSISFSRNNWPDVVMRSGVRVPTPRGRFLADPFVVTRGGMSCIFAEDYVFRTGKAHISAFELSGAGVRELGVALEEDFHLSFPYLFEFNGSLYMCPDTSAARQIRIYECTQFPLQWKLASVAMRDVTAVDTMIFEENGLWWLFTNISHTQPPGYFAELYLFSASTPLSTRWEPHRLNPVSTDPQYARNGGLLRDSGRLIRVAQSQGFQCYGARANLMQITRLSREEYAEQPVSCVTPTFMPGINGSHHLHSNGIYTVWDHKRHERI